MNEANLRPDYAPALVSAKKVLPDFGPEELETLLRDSPVPKPKD